MKRNVILLLCLSSFLFTHCKKDLENKKTQPVIETIKINNGRLVFTTTNLFKKTVSNMKSNPSVNVMQKLEIAIGSGNYSAFMSFKGYKNLYLKDAGDSTTLTAKDTLVEDPEFASLLSDKGEIQVDSSVYRITPFGTFMYIPQKVGRVDTLVALLNSGNTINKIKKDNYLYQVEDGVYIYDTFTELKDNTIEQPAPDSTLAINIPDSSISANATSMKLKSASFMSGDIEAHITSKNTWLDQIFGFDATYDRYFDSHHRVRVRLQSPNFVIFSYIRIIVKKQKQNWIGWWTTEPCPELVLGWDGIDYTMRDPFPINPQMQASSYNPTVSVGNLQPPFSKHTYAVFNVFGIMDVPLTDGDLAKGFVTVYNYFKGKYSKPYQIPDYFAIVPRTNFDEVVLGPEQLPPAYNAEEIDRVIDWAAGAIVFSWDMSSSIGLHNFSINPMTVTIKKASIYGVAIDGKKVLGIRIEKI